MTAIFEEGHKSQYNSVEVGMNGACVMEIDGTLKYFFHNQAESSVSLITLTHPVRIASSWNSQLSTLEHLTKQLAEVWRGAHYDTIFYCSHCLLTNQKELSTNANLTWPSNSAHQVYTGEEVVVCRQDSSANGLPSVPLPLVYPCE